MSKKPTILYVEDDRNLGFVTKDNLELRGYTILHCTDGNEAFELLEKLNTIDLCVLDIMLPTMDGFQLASKIRKINSQVPILFLSAKSLQEDRIYGFELGADDFITKPFSIEELCFKIEVFLKRAKVIGQEKPSFIYKIGSFTFNFEELILKNSATEINMTHKEAELLKLFCDHQNEVIRREEILKLLWGEDDYFMGRSLDVFISRLRKHFKIDPQIEIENIHKVGFRFKIRQ